MQFLRLTRYLRAASLAFVIAAIGTSQASAGLVLSGNTHPLDTLPPANTQPAEAVVGYAVYQRVGGTYGNATVDSFVASMMGTAGNFAYIFDVQNQGTTNIGNFGIGIDPTAVMTFGGASALGTRFDTSSTPNIFSPSISGAATAPRNDTGVIPTYTTGGQVPTPLTPFGGAVNLGSSLNFFFVPAASGGNGSLLPGGVSVLLGYTSNFAPTNSFGTSVQAGASSATGTIPGASPLPEPATVAMFATAIPFGLLYLKRRKAALAV